LHTPDQRPASSLRGALGWSELCFVPLDARTVPRHNAGGSSGFRPPGESMSTTTHIPVTVTPEASVFVEELGVQQEFEQKLEYTRQTIPGVLSLRAEYDSGYGIDTPCVLIEATVRDRSAAREAHNAWGVWSLTAFPPQVGMNFVLFRITEPENAR